MLFSSVSLNILSSLELRSLNKSNPILNINDLIQRSFRLKYFFMAESHLAYFKINLIEHTIRFLSRFLKSKEIYLHVNFESQKSVVSCSSILCRPTDRFYFSSKVVILGYLVCARFETYMRGHVKRLMGFCWLQTFTYVLGHTSYHIFS